MEFTNTNVLVEKQPYQEFKKQLIDRGMSFSQWVRDKIEEELGRNENGKSAIASIAGGGG